MDVNIAGENGRLAWPTEDVVSEPDPRKIGKEGLVNWLGWKCTLRPVWRHTSDWLLISNSDVRLLEMLTTWEPSLLFTWFYNAVNTK